MNKNRPQIRMEELKQDPATAELGGWVGEGPQNSSICIGVHGQVPRDHGGLRRWAAFQELQLWGQDCLGLL